MDIIFPEREAMRRHGWKYQVQWIEDGRPCFHRCTNGWSADKFADKLRAQKLDPVVIDLTDAMQIN